jgi:hypothetical protein
MTTLILAGLSGVLFHCLLKLNSLLQDARVANVDFRPVRDYWKKDVVSILISFLSVGIWYLVFGEVGNKYKGLQDFKITSFVVMGMIGSYIIQLIMSKAKKRIRTIVDEKTNIADNKT